MKASKIIYSIILCFGTLPIMAQSAVEALRVSETNAIGTARFIAMGGAFTSLGGDLSTLSQNPAGIGVYRSSEIAATLNISPQSNRITNLPGNVKNNKTRVFLDNVGFVGTMNFGENALIQNINFGMAFNRRQSYARRYNINYASLNGSLTNAIAGLCIDAPEDLLTANGSYHNGAPWLDILAFDNFLIGESAISAPGNRQYHGLWKNGTRGNGYLEVDESGYNNEYTFNFGGNISNRVFFGIGLGITDMRYHAKTLYGEILNNTNGLADIDGATYPIVASDYSLYNELEIKGTGVNFKVGLIGYITDSWRVGVAIHTPTYLTLSRNAYGDIINDFVYIDEEGEIEGHASSYTPTSQTDFSLRSPLNVLVGTSYIFGTKAIVSADYEFNAYRRMKMHDSDGYPYTYDNDDMSTYLENAHTVRIGAEYRITPRLSARAGYSLTTSPVSMEWQKNSMYVPTSGTYTSYTLPRTKQSCSAGLGYKFRYVYLDAAYQYRHAENIAMGYSAIQQKQIAGAEKGCLITQNHNIILTFGVKF